MSEPAPSEPAPSVELYDTTLRDGTQGEGLSLSCDDKLRIAERLDAFGMRYIEAGWPGSNPKDAEFFERAAKGRWKNASIVAFGSTRRADVPAQRDESLASLLRAETEVCTIFGKSWVLHVEEVLRTSLDENLRMVEESVALLQKQGRRVFFDAEHFFDGYRANADYALRVLAAAVAGGADALVLCDTNGGSDPWQVERIVGEVVQRFGVAIGIHPHDDGGCGVANAWAAVRAGASQVQGTINGYGERCGNVNLCTVAANLELKAGLRCLPEGHLEQLSDLAHFVAEVANLPLRSQSPYVGRSAFAHKGGVHVAAMRRSADSYQHIDPKRVGNDSRVLVSELSGRGNILSKVEELGIPLDAGRAQEVLRQIKESEARGFSYEAAEASVALLALRHSEGFSPRFRVVDYQATVGKREGSPAFIEATVKVQVGEQTYHTAGEGNGPVSALDTALRKALEPAFPQVREIQLADYKVRILSGSEGTSSMIRVLIDFRDGHRNWSTVGASTNIIEASLLALVDGIEFELLRVSV